MKNSWFMTVIGVGIILTVIIALNYSATKKATPLSEIFPEEEESAPGDVEYEFIDTKNNKASEVVGTQSSQTPKTSNLSVSAPKVEKLDSAQPMTPPTMPFTIQIASFKDKSKAEKALEDLKKKGYSAGFIVAKDVGEGNVRHRLYVGEFATKPQAEEFLANVKKDYSDSFLIQLRK